RKVGVCLDDDVRVRIGAFIEIGQQVTDFFLNALFCLGLDRRDLGCVGRLRGLIGWLGIPLLPNLDVVARRNIDRGRDFPWYEGRPVWVGLLSARVPFCPFVRFPVVSEPAPGGAPRGGRPRCPAASTLFAPARGLPATPAEWLFCSFVVSLEITVTG